VCRQCRRLRGPYHPTFGCDFDIPDLQPGVYNLVVQAFTSGTEGTMNLSLTGIGDTTLEICNNGIDDDGDGAIDCYDRKCAGDPSCQKLCASRTSRWVCCHSTARHVSGDSDIWCCR